MDVAVKHDFEWVGDFALNLELFKVLDLLTRSLDLIESQV